MDDLISYHSRKQSTSIRERLRQKKTDTFKLCDKKSNLKWQKQKIKRVRRQGKKPTLEELEIISQHSHLVFSKIQKRKSYLN